MAFGASKGGPRNARAARASKGHARRRGRLFAVSTGTGRAHYRGSKHGRAKRSWLF